MGIPKIIHQIWLQGKDQIPQKYHPLQESWLIIHKNWTYMLWDDRSIQELLLNRFPWFTNTYLKYPHMHQKIDSGRYFILYEYGGFYTDIDTRSIKPLDILLEQFADASMILSKLPFTVLEGRLLKPILGTDVFYTNAVIGTSKHFYVWESILPSLIKNRNKNSFLKLLNIMSSTGPAFFSLAIRKFLQSDLRIILLPDCYFESSFSFDKSRGYSEDAFAEHFQEATWHSSIFKFIFNQYFVLKNMLKGK